MSPNKGTFVTVTWTSSPISPPNTKILPSSTNTEVSISRLLIVGPDKLPADVASTLDTSCFTFSLMTLPSLICGVTLSLTPTSCRV